MTGGPWTGSMKMVHRPGPKWGSMDPWSMFCPHPRKTAPKLRQNRITANPYTPLIENPDNSFLHQHIPPRKRI